VKTGAQAGAALGNGLVQAGVIVGKPLATAALNLAKFII
jgi:hypothetical protein